jgi:predicted nucleic acid-binding protein
MFLLDTNVVSELRKPKNADANVIAWASSVPLAAQFLSAITVLELELGVVSSERKDASQGAVLRKWLDGQVLPQFSGRVLAFDQAVALRCARLHVPDRRPERDAIIAATALAHSMTVVTRNTKDFDATGVQLLNPWRPQP